MFEWLEAFLDKIHLLEIAVGALILLSILLIKFVRSEICRKKCAFCGEKVEPDEHGYHVTVCALRREIKLLTSQNKRNLRTRRSNEPAQPVPRAVSRSGSG